MGATGIAAANDATAIDFNPANLPNMALDGADGITPLSWGGTATYGMGDYTNLSVKIGAVGNEGKWGAGLGYEHPNAGWNQDIWGLGFGANAGGGAWSWGVSATRAQWSGGSKTWINAGLVCNIPQVAAPPIRVGVLATNILENYGTPRLYNVGVAVPIGDRVLLAADYWDVTDEWGRLLNFGAEVAVGPEWCVRAGRLNEDWTTAGAGYRNAKFSLDVAYIDEQDDEQWLVSGSIPF